MSKIVRESVLLGSQEVTIETGRLAKQAGGSVLIQSGDTIVLVTACAGATKPDISFFPLTCEYVEKAYAAGKIPGGYIKREGRLSEREVLASRLMDRPIRPLFPDAYRADTQIIATVLSMDQENDPDVLAMTGASAALMLSDMPFQGPIAGVRIGRIDGQWIANPTFSQREQSDVQIILAASEDAIVMVEGEAREVSEAAFLEAMAFGRAALAPILNLQKRLAAAVGKPNRAVTPKTLPANIVAAVAEAAAQPLRRALLTQEKHARYATIDAVKAAAVTRVAEQFPGQEADIKEAFSDLKSRIMRDLILDEGTRLDGRKTDQIRPISCEVGVLPRAHGSSVFTRGETQALVVATLGTATDEQRMDLLTGPATKRFMLHYNFPPFSVGETKPVRGPGRRELGHGMLAERALFPMIPTAAESYPYTVRLVSEILESNGSSSMASVCGGTLALLDAGVPMKKPVAGIAMGLIKDGDRVAVLSDILGDEDHMGDMDFKVCGTADGITAIQMDVKISGISNELMARALEQARQGRLHILGCMQGTLSRGRQKLSPFAPRIVTIKVSPDKIRDIIGSGGRTIRGIIAQTGVAIDVEDDGTVRIASGREASMNEALGIIQGLTKEAQVGEVYLGTVRRIVDFGAFIEIFPGTDGLCHVSELSEGRVENVSDVLSEGDEVIVKVLGIDRQGKIRLSRKAAIGEKPTQPRA
jgi:polyribonucleotide nucleotidyltransferase